MNSRLEYSLKRSRRRTICIEISTSGDVIVRAPMSATQKDIDKFLYEKYEWIQKTVEKVKARTPAEDIQKLSFEEIKELGNQAVKYLPDVIKKYAAILGVTYGRVTIRNQKTRWGSCSSKGNLNFNCLLMLCPERVREYVVIHELCHRKEMNHSKAFWSLVEQAMPDYKECKRWLRDNENQIMNRCI